MVQRLEGKRDQRWRALKRGLLLQITKTLPRRRTILQSRWRCLADLREESTFMAEIRSNALIELAAHSSRSCGAAKDVGGTMLSTVGPTPHGHAQARLAMCLPDAFRRIADLKMVPQHIDTNMVFSAGRGR